MNMSNVQDFGASGDGQSDATEAIQHAVNDGDGVLEFPRGDYRISRTIEIDLTKRPLSRLSIHGNGGAENCRSQAHEEGRFHGFCPC